MAITNDERVLASKQDLQDVTREDLRDKILAGVRGHEGRYPEHWTDTSIQPQVLKALGYDDYRGGYYTQGGSAYDYFSARLGREMTAMAHEGILVKYGRDDRVPHGHASSAVYATPEHDVKMRALGEAKVREDEERGALIARLDEACESMGINVVGKRGEDRIPIPLEAYRGLVERAQRAPEVQG